ncbi:arylformamidase [Candidatus Magnetomoraceae bacterium gMMP-15]
MKQWIFLSYFLDDKTPAYGNGESFKSEIVQSINQGDSCNTVQWTFLNHIGTHVDCPYHFSRNGKKLSDYHADFWIFQKIHLLDLSPISPGKIIDLMPISINSISPEVELLLIKTGFSSKRHESIYWCKNPGFSPGLADELRINFKQLRAIGFDSISISSWTNRVLGRKAHKAFLDHDRPILLIEDMDFSSIEKNTSLEQVIVSPFQVKNADAAPCTVMAEVLK